MRKMVLLAAMVAMAALMLAAAPALAADNDRNHDNDNDRNHDNRDFCDKNDCGFDDFIEEFCEDFDGDFFCDNEEDFIFDGFGDGMFQTSDQEGESGDVDQTFDISNTGDNSNQCVGVQGVANTGNAQTTINILNVGGEIDDFELEDLESSLTVSPENTTTCDQEVNQAATAVGGGLL
jgi:hypothetical protein